MALWLGGMVFFLIVMGAATRDLDAKIAVASLDRARTGFETASWIAIGLLLATGIANLLLGTRDGVLPLDGSYGILLGIKLAVFGAMVAHHCLQAFKHAPEIARLTGQVKPVDAKWPEPLLSRWRRWFLLLKINAALGPIAVLLGLALKQG
jgi:putative copper export protein